MQKSRYVGALPLAAMTCLAASGVLAKQASPVEACANLALGGISGTVIESTEFRLAQDDLPAHCEVVAAINRRISPVDGQQYAIRFRLRLPAAWNRRFYYSGGGGTDGNLGQANAAPIRQGFAVVSTDSGHDSGLNSSELAGPYQFGFDPQARIDYGYNGPAEVARKAKLLIDRFYAKPLKYSYFMGCSEGGREGLMLSQRYPDLFDGIVAGNPGMDLPKAAVTQAWDTQAFARAATGTTAFGNPDVSTSFTDADLTLVADAITRSCDAADGAADGMVFNPQACQFDPASLGPSGSNQLRAEQVTALRQVFAGPVDSAGRALYAGWYWDPGIAAGGWRGWKIGSPGVEGVGNTGMNQTLGGGSLPFVFNTPPNSTTYGTDLAGPTRVQTSNPLGRPDTVALGDAYVPYVLSYSMDRDAPKIYERDGIYQESSMSFMGTSSTDYRGFAHSRGKLLVYTGLADPVFSAKYHEQWYRRLVADNGGLRKTQRFARLHMVPGLNHCSGGPSTSQFDALGAMMNWVERGRAPASLLATAPEDTPWPGRTRPLCAYPAQAQYKGSGDIESASNFRCVVPAQLRLR